MISKMTGKDRLIRLGPILLITIIGVFTYYNSLLNAFVWDDETLIINNQLIRSYKYIGDIFKGLTPQGGRGGGTFYRPLTSLSYMLDYSNWRLWSLGYHLTSVLLHIINSLLVYFFIKRISKGRNIALLTASLFLLSPVLSEVVNFISARSDLLMGMLFLLSLLFFIDYRRANLKIYYFGSIFCFILSLLSKEMALILPFAVIFYDWVFVYRARGRPRARYIKDYAPYFLVILFYIALRVLLAHSGSVNLTLEHRVTNVDLLYRLLTTAKVIFLYFRLLIFPYDLHVERRIAVARSIFEPGVFLSLAGLVVLGVFLVYLYKKNKLAFFGLGWFFLTLLPASNIYPLNAFMGEGWIYIPAIGFWLLLSLGFERLVKISSVASKRFLYAGLILFLSLQIYFTVSRSLDWRSPLSFYLKDIKHAPYSAIVRANLGVEYFRLGDFKKAEHEFYLSTQLYNRCSVAHHNLGAVYERKNRFDAAIAEFKKSIEIDDFYLAYLSLGTLYIRLGEFDLAVEALTEAKEAAPYNAAARYNLGYAYYKKGDNKKAAQEFSAAIELDKKYVFVNNWVKYVDRHNKDAGE